MAAGMAGGGRRRLRLYVKGKVRVCSAALSPLRMEGRSNPQGGDLYVQIMDQKLEECRHTGGLDTEVGIEMKRVFPSPVAAEL